MVERPSIPAEIKREILIECGHRCAVCGTPTPLERAHIIPWHKSREHKAEDLICLCANCHERADKEKWGEKTLREYKQRPWVMRQYKSEDSKFDTNKISLAKIPTTNPDVFGREKELAMLDEAWNSEHKNIVMLVAFGGVGKTALVNKWLNNMELDNFRGAERVLGWSFYSQGSRQDGQASADQFIASALRWFGDPNPDEGSAWEKGERLAQFVRKKKPCLSLMGWSRCKTPQTVDSETKHCKAC